MNRRITPEPRGLPVAPCLLILCLALILSAGDPCRWGRQRSCKTGGSAWHPQMITVHKPRATLFANTWHVNLSTSLQEASLRQGALLGLPWPCGTPAGSHRLGSSFIQDSHLWGML